MQVLTRRGSAARFQNGIILEPAEHMATLTIKAMPDPLYERLRESAGMNHRSINSEVIARLEQALGSPRPDGTEMLERVRELRARVGGPRLTDAWLRETKEQGRP
jgi:antitoxin FitA